MLWPELVEAWELSADWAYYFDQREGLYCSGCRSTLRSQHLARGLLAVAHRSTGRTARCLIDLCHDHEFSGLAVAEINSAGDLHPHLVRLPHLRYSEYGSNDPTVRSEDLLALSYADDSVDVVITSDTLEHVPDVDKALREIHRILKPGGWHVFTVPVVSNRSTRRRASVADGRVTHELPASHHGSSTGGRDLLVYYEFGADFEQTCVAAGFELDVIRDHWNPALVAFLARKAAERPN